jgi:predicted 3-demethylubiquinone-9 3-methyltransferase (glyoxalase superfamily)
MPPVTPCLWFDGNAAAAVDQYVALFPNSRRLTDRSDDTPLMVEFELDGRPFKALNGGPDYHFTPAVSFSSPARASGS